MKLSTRLIFIFCSYIFTCDAMAQVNSDTLKISSLKAAIDIATQHNPTQAVYLEQIRQARYNYKATLATIYPNASASFNGTDNLHLAVTPIPGELIGRPGTVYNAQFGRKYVYNTGVTLSKSLFDWTNILETKIARQNIELSKLQQDAFLQTLKEQVARLYYSALIAKNALLINNKDSLVADSMLILSRQRLNQGLGDQLAVNQSAINCQNISQNKAQSSQLFNQSVENLKILLGAGVKTQLAFSEGLKLDSLQVMIPVLMQPDKSLGIYQKQADLAKLQTGLTQSAFLPKIAVVSYLGGQQFRDNFGLSMESNSWNAYRYIGINISVPIFTGFSNINKFRSATSQQKIAQLQYQNSSVQSEINDQLTLKNEAIYHIMVQSSAVAFHLYSDNLYLNKRKYVEGIAAIDTYLKAFQDYLAAENNYLNNLSLLLSNRAVIYSRQ